MPGLVVFRRRWSVGSDDLVVPGAVLLLIHFVCFVVVAVSLIIFDYNTSILSIKLLFYHLIGYLLILFFSICVEIGICVISMRGSILDAEARYSINVWIYLKSLVILFDITWLVLGTIWLTNYYLDAPVDDAKKFFIAIIISNWALVFMTLITIWCTFDAAGRSWVKMKKYQRSMRETESRFNYKRSNSMNRNWRQRKVMRAYQDSWDHRCRLLFCCMGSSERNRNSFTDIARLLSDFFRELDVVPSDVVAGLVLLRKFQKLEREAVVRQRKNGTYEFLSGVPITERTQFLALNDAKNYDFFQKVIHYMYFAQGAYGWPMYVIISRSKMWHLLPELKCFGCCCGHSDDTQIIQDNCCYCNYAALKKTLQVGDIEIVYVTYHVDVGETPFFVAIDYTQKKIVISIRGTLSMKDILTDLNAEGEVLPLTPPRDDWLGHKGMVQAAIYIRNKLQEETLIEKALNRNIERNTHTFGLVLVGHSLGAGTAAILAILLKPEYPTLQCFSYSPPGGLLSMPAAEYSKSFITSVVLGKDVVPRIGLNQMEALRADLINAIQRSVDPKWKTISCSVICCGCGPEPTSVVNMSGKDTHINQYQEERGTARTTSAHPTDSSIALTLHQPLYPPGRIIHIVRHHPKPDENVLKSREPVYQAIWADSTDFDEVLISPVMLQDHMPDKVLAALKKVVSSRDRTIMACTRSRTRISENSTITTTTSSHNYATTLNTDTSLFQPIPSHMLPDYSSSSSEILQPMSFALRAGVRLGTGNNPNPSSIYSYVVTTSGPRKPQRQTSNAFSTTSIDLNNSDADYDLAPPSLEYVSTALAAATATSGGHCKRPSQSSNSNLSNSAILTPTAVHKVCLETSFTNLQNPLELERRANAAQYAGGGGSKASSIAGSIFGRSQLSSTTPYDISSVLDDSITTVTRNSPSVASETATVIVNELNEHGVAQLPLPLSQPQPQPQRLKAVAFDMSIGSTAKSTTDTEMREDPDPDPDMHTAATASATPNTVVVASAISSVSPQLAKRTILYRQHSEKKPKSLPLHCNALRRASDATNPVDLLHDDWYGLAPLASPETLSEISSISSRTSVPISLANSIERYLQQMAIGELVPSAAVGKVPLENIFESQMHTPKVMRRAPKFTENLSTCAEDTRNIDQYKRMGRVFVTFPRIFPSDQVNSFDSSDDSFESAQSLHKLQPKSELLSLEKQSSKSADQLDDDNEQREVPTKKLTFSDSNILADDCTRLCPNCPCRQDRDTMLDCCTRIEHSQCASPYSANTNAGSADTTFYSANSSLEQFATPAPTTNVANFAPNGGCHIEDATLRPGLLESHFPVLNAVAEPSNDQQNANRSNGGERKPDVVGGRVRKRLSSEEFIFTRSEDLPLLVQIGDKTGNVYGSDSPKGRKRKGCCVYPTGNSIRPMATAAPRLLSEKSSPTTPRKSCPTTTTTATATSKINNESSV